MVFGLFSKEKALKRTIEKATNKLSQQPDRWAAMEKLRDDGSDEALYGLCKRFTFASLKSSEDEQEKSWVVEILTAKGAAVLPALRRYFKNNVAVAFALQVLEGLGDKAQILTVVDEIFADEVPGYTRDPEKRVQLIHWLGEWKGATAEDVVPRILPYVKDYDENVRFATIDALAHHPVAPSGPTLVEALVRPEEESRRLRQRIAEVLAEHAFPLGEHADAAAALPSDVLPGYRVDKGILVNTAAAKPRK